MYLLEKDELKFMMTSYGYLYEIENILRDIIISELSEMYGVNWEYTIKHKTTKRLPNKNFENLFFHELITYVKVINEKLLILPTNLILQLPRIVETRNKIAHNHCITSSEFQKIKEICILLKHEVDKKDKRDSTNLVNFMMVIK